MKEEKWFLITSGNYSGSKSFRGKMGMIRTLRKDETIFGFVMEKDELHAEKVLGRRAWRFPQDESTFAMLKKWEKKLQTGTPSNMVLEEIERYWGE